MSNEILFEALSHIRLYGPRTLCGGLCVNLEELIDEFGGDCTLYVVARMAMGEWPEHSGEDLYPVDGVSNYKAQEERGTLWDNPKRWDLVDFLLNYFH